MSEKPYRRLSPLTPLARSGIFVVAAVTTTWRDLLRGDLGPLGWVLLGLLVAGAVYGAASWFRTKYWIEADELRVDTGVVTRQSRRIRIDRLQGVDIVQPFVARLLGLAELRMDVAGGGAREGRLAFLSLADARELKDLLLDRRDRVLARDGSAVGTSARPADAVPVPPGRPPVGPDRLLARVDLGLLLGSTLVAPETVALVLAATLFAAARVFVDAAPPLPVFLPVVGGLGLVLFRRVAGSYGFSVTQTPAGLQVRRGLFELSSQTVALHRVQGVVLSEPLMWRPFGWSRVDISVAGYAASSDDNGGPSASTVLPVGDRALASWLARHVLGGVDAEQVRLTGPPERARWVSPIGRRFMAAGADPSAVVSRGGWFTRTTHVVPHARVQSLRLTQGPIQRRLGLADVHVDSPPGPVKVRARDRLGDDARALFEYEIEASRAARPLAVRPAAPERGSGSASFG